MSTTNDCLSAPAPVIKINDRYLVVLDWSVRGCAYLVCDLALRWPVECIACDSCDLTQTELVQISPTLHIDASTASADVSECDFVSFMRGLWLSHAAPLTLLTQIVIDWDIVTRAWYGR